MIKISMPRLFAGIALMLLTVSAIAAPFKQQGLLGSWCFHTLEYADGNESNEKATYTFAANGQVTVQESSYETRSAYRLKDNRLKMDKLGRLMVRQLTSNELVLQKPNVATMYLNRGACR